MRSRVIGAPLSTIVIASSRAIDDSVDAWIVNQTIGQPITLTLPPSPNDGDAFSVFDGLGNGAAQPISIVAGSAAAPVIGSANISTNLGGVALLFSTYRGGWIVTLLNAATAPAPQNLQVTTPTTLAVDPVNGNDATALGPFKTVARLNQVLAGALVTSALTITLPNGDIPASDAKLAFSATAPAGGTVAVVGTPIVLRSSSLTAATTSLSSGTNQREILDDTTIGVNGWAAFVGDQVVCTSGAHSGVSTYVASNVAGGTTCNAGQPLQAGSVLASGTLANGDSVSVQRFPNLSVGDISISTDSTTTPLSFQNVNLVARPDGFSCELASSANFLQCTFAARVGGQLGTAIVCQNCYLAAGFTCDRLTVSGGVLVTTGSGSISSDSANLLAISANVYVTGNCIFVGSGTGRVKELQLTTGIAGGQGAQFQDCTNVNGALIFSTCKMNVGGNVLNATGTGGRVWGNGNTGFGIVLYYGAHVSVLSTAAFTPKVTGAAGDFCFDQPHAGGFNANAVAWDPSTQAYSTFRATTWANWTASIAGGGFNFNAHGPDIDAHLVGV